MGLMDLFKNHSTPPAQEETFSEALTKKFPEDKRLVHIMSLLYDHGIVAQIKDKFLINNEDVLEYVSLLEDDYGISPTHARNALFKWAKSAGINVTLARKPQPTAMPKDQNETTTKESPNCADVSIDEKTFADNIPLIYGDLNDYEVRLRDKGWFITKYNGFDKSNMTVPNRIDDLEIVGIAYGAYQGCRWLEVLGISEGIEEIESGAFRGCTNIKAISLPNSLKILGSSYSTQENGLFSHTKISSIVIPPNVEQLGPYTFCGCDQLWKVTLSDKIEVIPDYAFSWCRKLSQINFPMNLKAIKNWAFNDCGKFDVIKIPYGTEYIGYGAFGGYTSIKDTYVPPTVTEISEGSHPLDRKHNPTLRGVIHCTTNSEAMRFAREHNLKCVKADFQ